MQELALDNNIRAIRYIDNPTEEMMIKAVNAGWSILDYIKNPTDKVIAVSYTHLDVYKRQEYK